MEWFSYQKLKTSNLLIYYTFFRKSFFSKYPKSWIFLREQKLFTTSFLQKKRTGKLFTWPTFRSQKQSIDKTNSRPNILPQMTICTTTPTERMIIKHGDKVDAPKSRLFDWSHDDQQRAYNGTKVKCPAHALFIPIGA